MRLDEAMARMLTDDVIFVLGRKRIRGYDRGISKFSLKGTASFEQSLRSIRTDKWLDWNETNLALTLEEITSDKWEIWKEEEKKEEMGFAEALEELVDRDDDSIMYQAGNPYWLYKLGEERPARFILQKHRESLHDWKEYRNIQITKDMLAQKDWVIKSADKKEEEPKNEKCDCVFHRALHDM